jgi:hypothetical protein
MASEACCAAHCCSAVSQGQTPPRRQLRQRVWCLPTARSLLVRHRRRRRRVPLQGWIGSLADFTPLRNRSHTAVNVSNGSKARMPAMSRARQHYLQTRNRARRTIADAIGSPFKRPHRVRLRLRSSRSCCKNTRNRCSRFWRNRTGLAA